MVRRAFSLIELLMVMVIISIVIAILVPSLGSIRTLARQMETESITKDFVTGSAAFVTDNRRIPGYFPIADLASADNDARGMSAMENAMLDLAGADAILTTANADTIEVGPIPGETIEVNPDLIGTGDNVYIQLDGKYLVAQTKDGTVIKQSGAPGHTDREGERQLPDVVDAFGSPLLLWTEDATAVAPINRDAYSSNVGNLAGMSSDDNSCRFYWMTNKAFLDANKLGRLNKDQTTLSALGSAQSDSDRISTLVGLLGSPGFPNEDFDYPTATRGKFVVHSAGKDGVYLGVRENAWKEFKDIGFLDYSYNHADFGGNRWDENDDGVPDSIDVTERFNDIITSGGG
jgi:prepilin-type N-terminal cleavage/methylation domain-containing protein